MADYDGIPLQLRDGGPARGLALRLDSPAYATMLKKVDGWDVELREGSQVVVAREPCVGSNERYTDDALEAIQCALDQVSVYARRPLTTPGCHHNWTSFNFEGSQQAVDVVSTVTCEVGTAGGAMFVIDKDGKRLPDPEPLPVAWHQSLRFYRMFRASIDLNEAGRNLSLALESLLSKAHPHSGGGGDKNWFKDALKEMNRKYKLDRLPGAADDVVKQLISDHYTGVRCELMHAKDGRSFCLPASDGYRSRLQETLEFVESVFLSIAEGELGVRGGGGGVTLYAVKEMAKSYLNHRGVMWSIDWAQDRPVVLGGSKGNLQLEAPVIDSQANELTVLMKVCFLAHIEHVKSLGIVDPEGDCSFVTLLPGQLNTRGLAEIRYYPRVVFLNFGDRAYFT